ncbi:citrate/2-methylcitrate synthase [Leifsonia sp. AG29]|uniref:citrate/2-methylcitrate synthase n=1 Tax=Leifsonia sp. AG29 TaxID=2598860 RepID=UPI00131E0907|nr:citrate/2-methylcitrate synthase [Leifsonia sp. AG29]
MEPLPRLTAEQTAERLGVKLETLYAYVARGRLARRRTAEGSTFDPLEVERFAAARRRRPAGEGHSAGRPLMVIDTTFALIDDGDLFFRGRRAADLAHSRFETVARWALTGSWEEDARFTAGAGVETAREVVRALPESSGDRDRQLVAVTALAVADPFRHSLRADIVAGAAERIVSGMVAVLDDRAAGHADDPLAVSLWHALTRRQPSPAEKAALNAALVLLIDHDIAVSTLAARAAASARAGAYAVVTAGLGALDSPLHGNASRAAHRMLARVADGDDPARVVADSVLTASGPVPGFGHPLYPGGDPRARTLLEFLAEVPGSGRVLSAVDSVADLVGERTGAHPTIDLALGALSLAAGMPDDAGEVIFATGRTVGWIVHALDEYREQPLRLRPVGRYTG